MVKQWFQELKDDVEELLQIRFIFKSYLINDVNQLSCNLYRCFYPIVDGFISCQTCRCHGIAKDKSKENMRKSYFCPVTRHDLGEMNLIENFVKIEESTILLMPSFQCCQKLRQISSSIDFSVVERMSLGSLTEGVIFGAPYVVAPSTSDEYDDTGSFKIGNASSMLTQYDIEQVQEH